MQAIQADQSLASASHERGRSRRTRPSCPSTVVPRGRQVHRRAAQPEPGARVPARHEAALRRRGHRGTSAPGRAGRRRELHRDQPTRHATQVIDGEQYYWKRNGGGNPKLRPWKANTFDLSFEKYFGDNKGYVSAAVYYKDLDTYIFNQSTVEDFTGVPLPPVPGRSVDLRRGGRESHRRLDAQVERQRRLRPGLRAHGFDAVLVVLGAAGWLRLHRERRQEQVVDQDQR